MPAPSAQVARSTPPEILALPIKLVDTATASGVDFAWQLPEGHIDIQQTIGHGAAFFDFDGDGWVDLLLVGPRPQLYHNLKNGHFKKIAVGLDSLPTLAYMGVGVGDYDRDGHPDVILSAWGGAVLLHNEGGKRLHDVTSAMGIDVHGGWTSAVTFADLDRDGWPELIIGHYLKYDRKLHKFCQRRGYQIECGPLTYDADKPQVFHNLGGKRFQEVTKEWGFDVSAGKNLGVLIADLDGDGQVEVIFANDQAPGDLFVRRGAELFFQNQGMASGTAYNRLGVLRAGMGVDAGDYDRDGRIDLTIMGMDYQGGNLFHNIGKLQYKDVAGQRGLKVPTVPWFGFGSLFFDVDNDGWMDLAIANGHFDVLAEKAFDTTFKQPFLLLYNRDGTFYDLSTKVVAQDLKLLGRGLSAADYDHDGKVDLLVVDSSGAPLLLHNETEQGGHYLSIRLRDRTGDANLAPGEGVGTTVYAQIGGKPVIMPCHADGSYVSVSDTRVHLGLGQENSVPEITVQWPSGRRERFGPFSADQRVEVLEGTGQQVQGKP